MIIYPPCQSTNHRITRQVGPEECITRSKEPFLEWTWLESMREFLMRDGLADLLWNIGRGRKNMWVEGLWDHLLNSIICVPWLFKEDIFFRWKLVLNTRVEHFGNNLLLLISDLSFFSSSSSLLHTSERTEGWRLDGEGKGGLHLKGRKSAYRIIRAFFLCTPKATIHCNSIWSVYANDCSINTLHLPPSVLPVHECVHEQREFTAVYQLEEKPYLVLL